jgi:hypothetical protein
MTLSSVASCFAFRSHGVRLGVETADRSLLARLRERLPPDSRPLRGTTVDHRYAVTTPTESPAPRSYSLVRDGQEVVRRDDVESLLNVFEADVRFTVSLNAPRRVFLHAGVVGWNGGAILLPGRSRVGKTTLVAALVAAGATYYSDEFAVLDPDGRVHPFEKHLSMRNEDGTAAREVPPHELGAEIGRDALPVALVVFTRFAPDARWAPEALTPGQTMLGLLAHTMAARPRPELAMAALKRVVTDARSLASDRGAAETVVPRLLGAALPRMREVA